MTIVVLFVFYLILYLLIGWSAAAVNFIVCYYYLALLVLQIIVISLSVCVYVCSIFATFTVIGTF